MKILDFKLLFFGILTFLGMSLSYAQIIITEIADPNNAAGARYVELYNLGSSSVNLNTWALRRWTNDNSSPQSDEALSGTIAANGFIIFATNSSTFNSTFPSFTGTVVDMNGGGPTDSNGDDKIALIDGTGTLVDIFGTPGSDSNNANTAENFEDGRAERVATVTAPNSTWTASEWNVDNDQGFGSGAQNAPAGFDPGAWIGVSTGPDNPSTFTASLISSSQIDLTYDDNANDDFIVIVFDTDNTFTTPSGTVGPVGTSFADGTVLAIVNGSGTFNHTGRAPNTTYYYKAWSFDGSNNYSLGLEVNETTPAPTINTFPYSDDFETANNNWLATSNSATEWERGAPVGAVLDASSSGSNAFGTDLDSNYLVNTDAFLTSPIFDNSANASDLQVSFQYWVNSEAGFDGLFFEYSLDGGGSWTKLTSGISNWYNNTIDEWWDGTSATGFTQASATIPGSANDTEVQVRFAFSSDNTIVEEGALIDDFEIFLANDSDSDIDGPPLTLQPDPVFVSSLADTDPEAIRVFDFDVYDFGSGDGLPTTITQVTVDAGTNNDVDWSTHIENVKLSIDGGSTYANIGLATINSGSLVIPVDSGLVIADGEIETVSLYIYLKNSGLTDNGILEFTIPTSHGFTADVSGSTFSTNFSNSTTSNEILIDVVATQLSFLQQPTDVEVNTVMTPAVQVAYTDVNGNIDNFYTGTGADIALTTSGSLDASAIITVEAVNGVATFSDLIFDTSASSVNITATDDSAFITGSFQSADFDVLTAPIFPTAGDLIITEVSDASDFNNEFIEIYNTTSTLIDMSTSKLIMQNDGTVWDFNDDIPNAVIPPNGFLIVTRGGTQTAFETEFGTLNAQTVFIQGSGGMFFGTGSSRSWQLYAGGTASTADGTLIDDTVNTIAGSGNRDYFDFLTDAYVTASDASANPGVNDNLVYESSAWKYNAKADATTGESNVYFQDDFTSTETIAMNDGEVSANVILDLDTNDLNVNGTFTFKSNATSTAQLEDATGAALTGEVTVERYIPAGTNTKRAFRFLTSAVSSTGTINANWQEGVNNAGTNFPADNQNPNPGFGTHITGGASADGFDQSGTNNPSMFTFNNDFVATGAQTQTDAWTALPTTNSKTLQAGEPYLTFVRGDRSIDVTSNSATPTNTTLRATGSLHTGSLTFDFGNPTDYLSLSGEDDYYNLVGNPYQAIVDFSAVTRSGLTDFIYVWDASVSDAGSYVTVDITGNTTPPNPFSSDASEFIAPGQSFFVQNDNAPGDSSITFEEADKATGATEVTVFDTYPHFYINSRLYKTSDLQNGDSESDALGLRFSDNYTTLGNNNEDATKLDNPGETYAVINNGLRSIDYQEIPTLGHEVDFSITNYTETNYSLTFAMENKPSGLGVFLRDNYLNTQTELTESFVYDFTVDANIPGSNAENRFSLIFDNTTLGIDDNNFGANFSLYPNPTSNGLVSIQTPNLSGEVSVEISNLLGQQVSSQELTVEGQQVDINAQNLSTGLYVVKLSQGNQSFSSKLIVE